jgi:cell wall-associated NlpC family hydrolase
VTGEQGDFLALADGSFMPRQHLAPIDAPVPDPVACFEGFLGVPYLWGGNSVWGVDCSGVVQLVLEAANQKSERDADMQEAGLGQHLPPDAALQRGDLVFWQGHVGMMRDAETLIHANVHHMAVASEPVAVAIARIQKNGGGPVTSCKRL